MTQEITRFVEKHLQEELGRICKSQIHSEPVEFEVVRGKERCGVRFEGSSIAITLAKLQVETWIGKSIQERHYPATKIGMKKIISGTKGIRICQSLETEMKTTIEIIGNESLSCKDARQDASVCTQLKKCSVNFRGATLMVVKADLVTYQVDAIVNTVNPDLSHYSGLAGALVKAGDLKNVIYRTNTITSVSCKIVYI